MNTYKYQSSCASEDYYESANLYKMMYKYWKLPKGVLERGWVSTDAKKGRTSSSISLLALGRSLCTRLKLPLRVQKKEKERLISKEIGKRRKSIFRDRIGSILSELARIQISQDNLLYSWSIGASSSIIKTLKIKPIAIIFVRIQTTMK